MGEESQISPNIAIQAQNLGRWQATKAQKLIAVFGVITIIVLALIYSYILFLSKKSYLEAGRLAEEGKRETEELRQKRLDRIRPLVIYIDQNNGSSIGLKVGDIIEIPKPGPSVSWNISHGESLQLISDTSTSWKLKSISSGQAGITVWGDIPNSEVPTINYTLNIYSN